MEYILGLIAIIIIVPLALYWLAPGKLFKFMRDMLRKRAGLVEKSVQVGDLTWPYLEAGPKDGEPVVLIHGFGADKDNWAMYAPQLVKKYRLISPDLPGFGENSHDPDLDYGMAAQAVRLKGFLDALGISKPHLGGNSMGGFLALQFAVDFPDHLTSLTLLDNAGITSNENHSEIAEDAENGLNPLEIRSPDDVKRMMAMVAYKPTPLPGQFRKVFYQEFAKNRDLHDKIYWQMVEDSNERSLDDRLHEVIVPTLIIWGKHDRLIDVSTVKVLTAGIKDAQAVILDKIGHIPMIENPALTAQHQLPFLEKHTISNSR